MVELAVVTVHRELIYFAASVSVYEGYVECRWTRRPAQWLGHRAVVFEDAHGVVFQFGLLRGRLGVLRNSRFLDRCSHHHDCYQDLQNHGATLMEPVRRLAPSLLSPNHPRSVDVFDHVVVRLRESPLS